MERRRKKLRDYQQAMLDSIIETQDKNSINVMEPGGGKTLVMSRLAEYLLSQGKGVVVLSISVLVRRQLEEEFLEDGVEGVIFSSPLIMARRNLSGVSPDVFIIDEAHHAVADKYLELFEKYPEAKRYGFTATPTRNDKKCLADVFDFIYSSKVDTRGLIDRGVLEKFIYYAPSTSDIASSSINPKHLLVGKGGYRTNSGTSYFKGREIYGDIIKSWKKYAGGDYKTLLFAPDVDTAEVFAEKFLQEGVSSTYISSKLSVNENFARIEGFKSGKYQVLCNYNMVSEGFNLPEIDCVILTHTTQSYTLYKQRVFRALRKSGKNRHAVVLDHGDNSSIHGMLDDLRNFTISTSDELKQKEEREKDFERLGGDWGYFENRGVELVEVYRYGKGYDSKYDKLIEKANKLANLDGLMLLFEVQAELGIRSSGSAPAWAYAYAREKGYEGVPSLEEVK